MRRLKLILASKRGASAAEYALILAIIGAAIALASIAIGIAIADSMNDASSNIAG